MATPGSGYKIANDVLTEMAYHLVEPVVSTLITSFAAEGYGDGGYGDGGYGDGPDGPGSYEVGVLSLASLYVGAQVILGRGLETEEVVTVLSLGTLEFGCIPVNQHAVGESVTGATFPVCEVADPFFSQAEMLNYVASAQNDYLLRVSLVYAVTTQNFVSGQMTQAMPPDAMQIERIACNGFALQEQSQTSLDLLFYTWGQQAAGLPRAWYEDRTGLMVYGVDRIPQNAFSVEVLYAQRDNARLALNEGFLLPDPFLTYVKYGALAAVFAKDGEMKDPERARYCQGRFDTGVKIGSQFLENAVTQQETSNA